MNIISLLAAFGGGIFGAAVGGVPAFIFTGIFAIVGGVAGMCGAADASNILVNHMAFGSFFGPHVAFAGGVAAAAYAKKKGSMENGADIVSALAGINAPDVLLVGGVFGVIGYLFKELVIANLFAGTISPRLVTDAPGITVFCSALLVRAIFGGARFKTSDNFISSGNVLGTTIVIAAGYSLVVAGVYCGAIATGIAPDAFAGLYPTVIFGLAAVGLTFTVAGQPYFGCHHICIIAAEATVQSYARLGNLFAALVIGVIFGTISGILADIEGNTINCGTDSHIDNPAFAIFIMTFVVNACFPVA